MSHLTLIKRKKRNRIEPGVRKGKKTGGRFLTIRLVKFGSILGGGKLEKEKREISIPNNVKGRDFIGSP